MRGIGIHPRYASWDPVWWAAYMVTHWRPIVLRFNHARVLHWVLVWTRDFDVMLTVLSLCRYGHLSNWATRLARRHSAMHRGSNAQPSNCS